MEYNNLLIQTKLHHPVQVTDPVQRPRLTSWLNQNRDKPLTLVSAPAGYGKSTLVSEWTQSLDCLSAWVSLDQYDHDLGVFLSYFIGAIQTIFPENLVSDPRSDRCGTDLDRCLCDRKISFEIG